MKERRNIVISSLKGGTGKTTTTINIGRALLRRGYKVGLLDVDATAPKLSTGLGLSKTPPMGLDSKNESVLPFQIEGMYALTLASHYTDTPAVLWDEAELVNLMRELLRDVKWPDDLDYLLLDSPPSSSGFMQALYDNMENIYGIVLVFQPTDMATADLLRTLDFMKVKKVPVIGLLCNMAYCISPKNEEFWPFLSPKVDISSLCRQSGIPLLGEVPMTSDRQLVEQKFDQIVSVIESIRPVKLQDDIVTKMYKSVKRSGLKAVVKKI